MDLSKLTLLNGIRARMDFLSARSSILAQNIANADTPGYVRKDITAGQFESALEAQTQMATTDARHQPGVPTSGSANRSSAKSAQDPTATPALTGNQVSIETETMELSRTRMEYGLAATVYRKGLDMMRLAIRSDR